MREHALAPLQRFFVGERLEVVANLGSCAACLDEGQPGRVGFSVVAGNDFHHVAIRQFGAQWYRFAIDLGRGGSVTHIAVDGVGEVLSRHGDARSERFRIRAPKHLAKYISHKGSITVDGTSLTVNAVDGAEFELNIVPHTLEKTVMGTYKAGTQVNLEVDLLARYLERLLLGDKAAGPAQMSGGLSMAFLTENGFNRGQ